MNDILRALQQRLQNGQLRADESDAEFLPEPLDPSTVEAVESQLGFRLPSLLREIYLSVANGGFGYAYGLLGLRGGACNEVGEDVVSLYRALRQPDPEDPHWYWPECLLPVFHLGCAMYHCVRCDVPDAPVVWFEPNPHSPGESWQDSFIPFAPSLTSYLQVWLNGRDPFEEFLG